MKTQTKCYLEDMKKMYEVIMRKCIDKGEINNTDLLFLQIYKKTIDNNVNMLGFRVV